ncbi:hypothetical protein ABW20_dc0100895 [Dactylellina cionopaga]|nr:hypothetical protein ABW20_dc0100895 [Dactylellina cionopaga]
MKYQALLVGVLLVATSSATPQLKPITTLAKAPVSQRPVSQRPVSTFTTVPIPQRTGAAVPASSIKKTPAVGSTSLPKVAAPSGTTLPSTPAPGATLKQTLAETIPKLGLSPQIATFFNTLSDSALSQIAKLPEPQLTQAIQSLLQGKLPAGIKA